jgi:periplasmic protein TonB
MKKRMLLITGLLYFAINGFSQTMNARDSALIKEARDANIPIDTDTNTIFTREEVNAQPPSDWDSYLNKNLNTFVAIDNNAPAGTYTIELEFVVRKDGSITDVQTLTNYGYGMEEEAIRVLKNSPKWIPASQNGHIVNAYKIEVIPFVVKEQ